MAQQLLGKEVAAALKGDLTERVEALKERGVEPMIALVRVGARPDDLSYERMVLKRAESLGIMTRSYVLAEEASQQELEEVLAQVNEDEGVHGCLLFRPLPATFDEEAACNMLAVEKDVDGISRASMAAIYGGDASGFAPCTAQACVEMLDHYGIPVAGKRVVVVGRSLVIGKPAAMLLLARHATVTMCHSRTENLPEVMREADIVICATGRARAYDAACFRAGQTVLDVGINFDEAGAMCGDVDFASVEPVVGAITPVPGGIGTVTTSVTLAHVVAAAERMAAKR